MIRTIGTEACEWTVLALIFFAAAGSVDGAGTNINFKTEFAAKLGFDNNVYLQDQEPDRATVPQAVSPFQKSIVISLTPKLALEYKPRSEFNVDASYAPEVVFYTSESSENHVAHRGALNLGGEIREVPWRFANSFTYVQGSDEGLYFGAPGGAPAIGGVPIRDRRRQFVYRSKVNAIWTYGKWFFRPEGCFYVHDFQTEQRHDAGYENYIDRREMCVGGDVGYEIMTGTRVYAGYRYGLEVQGHMLESPYHYDAEYHRPVVGMEGQPAKWIKVNFGIGPDIHHTIHRVAPGFDPDYTRLWVNGVLTLMPTSQDSIAFTWTRNTQPAFASTSVYDDVVYDITGRHGFNERWSAGAEFRAYNGDWFPPVERDDWIYTISGRLGYQHDEHVNAELAYSYDWAESKVPNTEGREFTRHLVWLSLRYRF